MKTLIFLIFASTAWAQFPFVAPQGQWLSTDSNGGVNAGYYAGSATPSTDAVRIGFFAGAGSAFSGVSTVAIGRHAGYDALAPQSVILGHAAGQYAGKGGDASSSVILGYLAGRNAQQLTPHYAFLSVILGNNAATNTKSVQTGVVIGATAGQNMTNGVGSVLVGYGAGANAVNANNCVFIGAGAGANLSRNNTLAIESNGAAAPLIYGEFDTRTVQLNTTKFSVNGAPPVPRATITGSRSDGTALTQLLQALHALGLILDETTP